MTIEGSTDVDLVDGELVVGSGSGVVEKVMTCISGAKTGTFTISSTTQTTGGGWQITDATGDFVGLSGTGAY